VPTLNDLIDEPRDILALFGGIAITLALIVMVFTTGFGEIIVGALIIIVHQIYTHFFQKKSNGSN